MPKFLEILGNIIKLQCTKTCQETGGCSVGGIVHKGIAVVGTVLKPLNPVGSAIMLGTIRKRMLQIINFLK